MRFMMIVKASPESEAGQLGSPEEFAAMGRYNEQLIDAGILLVAEGLQASSSGARVTFKGGKTSVTDGPFAEAKELIAGFWIIDVKSMDEALAWAKRIPFKDGEVEVRKVFEFSDLPSDVVSDEHRRKEAEWRGSSQKPAAH